ncbi:MAG TPA: PhzF family phenazine biosynthesis protein [Steroidobacteraceae bacterium]|jgi:PhzF family phenazine biosynthesis protein|nr:PhzF family phenazine biosynthesis protein [Steroidobacteraceae bacterium]
MRARIFQVDAFASKLFTGNPAAVMPLDYLPEPTLMQAIAEENNLSETAFIAPEGADYRIRWFTPKNEVPLCGHATLASAAVVMERLEPGRASVVFHSASGPLTVKRSPKGYVMDFPARHATPVARPRDLAQAIGADPLDVVADDVNYLARLNDADAVRNLRPDIAAIATLDRKGVIVTAQGTGDYDFVSRYFAPAQGVPEDPVTGSAHCALAPYWAAILGKSAFRAFQASRRGGEVECRYSGGRVELTGTCVFYLEGQSQL